MPYRMPRARLENGTIVDREVLDRILQDPASKLAGGLNEHDIGEAVYLTETPDPGLFYKWYKERLVTDPWIINAGVPEHNGNPGSPAASFIVPNSKQWEAVGSMDVSVTTDGDSALWICAHVVYAEFPWTWTATPNPPHDLVDSCAGIEIGIRVDGVLLQTYTGRREENEWDFAAVRPDQPKIQTIGTKVIRFTHAITVGPHFFSIRDILPAFVQAGDHTIELVCRRPRGKPYNQYTPTVPWDLTWVEFYTRKLFVLELPITGGTKPAGQAPNLVSMEDGDVFSTVAVQTNRLDALAAAYNAVLSGDVRRGGLCHEHYPTSLLAASQGVITSGNTCAHVYPGFGSQLQDPADPGWWRVVNGAGVHLHTDNGGVGWDNPAGSLLLVLAQVHVNSIKNAEAGDDDIVDYGCFTIMKKIAGVWTQFAEVTNGEAESYVNACNWAGVNIYPKAGTPVSKNIELEVTLFDWMTPTLDFQDIGVWVSAYGPNTPTVTWDKGAIQVLQLRPQT